MYVHEELLSILLDEYPDWNESPEGFLGLISMYEFLLEIEAKREGTDLYHITGTADELAEIFIRVLEVDIYPYPDFSTLKKSLVLEEQDLKGKLEAIVSKMKEEDAFFELAGESGIAPSIETMAHEIANDLLNQQAIELLRPYVHFR